MLVAKCAVCYGHESRTELVEEVCRVDGRRVLVGGIPASVCVRCGEQTFNREITEKVRLMVHGEGEAKASVPMQVYDFASSAS